eukprot:RCo045224
MATVEQASVMSLMARSVTWGVLGIEKEGRLDELRDGVILCEAATKLCGSNFDSAVFESRSETAGLPLLQRVVGELDKFYGQFFAFNAGVHFGAFLDCAPIVKKKSKDGLAVLLQVLLGMLCVCRSGLAGAVATRLMGLDQFSLRVLLEVLDQFWKKVAAMLELTLEQLRRLSKPGQFFRLDFANAYSAAREKAEVHPALTAETLG